MIKLGVPPLSCEQSIRKSTCDDLEQLYLTMYENALYWSRKINATHHVQEEAIKNLTRLLNVKTVQS